MTEEKSDHGRISPTAWFIAEGRTYSDIPYSKEIFAAMHKMRAPSELIKQADPPNAFSRFEARYLIVGKLLKENKSRQILEIAAGFSPRGLLMADDPSVNYVENDLPEMLEQKKTVLSIMGKKAPKNLHLEAGNVLKMEDLRVATRFFDKKLPIAVIHEGLLRYFTFAEKETVARNVRTLLGEFGGVWITSDIDVTPQATPHQPGGVTDQIRKITGIDIVKNDFKTLDEAILFFEKFGFSVEIHPYTEMEGELVSTARLKLTPKQVKEGLERSYVFVMRLRK